MSMNFASAASLSEQRSTASIQKPFSVLINNDVKVIDKVVNNIQRFIKNNQSQRFSLAEIRQLIIKSSTIIDKRLPLDETVYCSGRSQSVAWYFINEFLECEIDSELNEALNKLLLQLSIAFDRIGELSAEGISLEYIDIARDLNETMKLLNIPINFHNGLYGKQDNEMLRSKTGRSSLRRPIAKAELVLAWAGHLLRLTRVPEKYTKTELTFINLLGVMLDAFVKRYDLIVNIKYHQPCFDHLAFIRLMEIVYITCIRTTDTAEPLKVYASWYDQPAQFKYIQDFCDIRLNLEGIKSHLSRLPRNLSEHSSKCTVFYNPVKCLPESPIFKATSAWLNAVNIMRNNCSFDTIVKETALASFGYEYEYANTNGETVMEPAWYEGINAFMLTATDNVEMYSEQITVIEEALRPIEQEIKENVLPESIGLMNTDDMNIVFSVMLQTDENDKPVLSYIKL